ncbi:hypothetical protein KCU67_g5208, partial [Aureobasidium melanogenum]
MLRIGTFLVCKLLTSQNKDKVCYQKECMQHDLDKQKKSKTYSSRDSHVVTHRSTNLPFNCLCMAERTGCPVFS